MVDKDRGMKIFLIVLLSIVVIALFIIVATVLGHKTGEPEEKIDADEQHEDSTIQQ